MIVRTLFHFIHINEKGGEYWVRIPAWDHNLAVRITAESIAPEMLPKIHDGFRCHGTVNLKADRYDQLQIHINEE